MINESIIAKSREGDIRAFTELVGELSPVAWRIAFRILADNGAAEDIAQEALVKVWKKIGGQDGKSSFDSWFYKIVINCCYDELRRRRREVVKPADYSTWLRLGEIIRGDNGSEPTVDEYQEILRTVTSELSPKQRAVFVLSDLEGMDNEQIIEITGLNANSLKSHKNLELSLERISRILQRNPDLLRKIEKEYGESLVEAGSKSKI